MAGMAFINGDYVAPEDANISVFDLGFTRSDVVYDVTSSWKGFFFRLDDHIDRFLASCAGIHLDMPYSADELKRILANCVIKGDVPDAYVSMALTRGSFMDPLDRRLRQTKPTFIAYAIPYVWIASPELQIRGLDLRIAETHRIPDSAIDQRYKNYHWGDLTRGLWDAQEQGADTAVLCTPDGSLAEGPGFNVFFLADGCLKTPARNALRGMTRRTVLELAEEAGLPHETGDYSADDLREADEIFLSSTAGGIMPVRSIDGRHLSNGAPGPISMQLRHLYWLKREDGWHGTKADALAG